MKLYEITSVDKLKRAVSQEYCVVCCTTSWSVPGRSQCSILARVAKDYVGSGVIFKIDINKRPDAAAILTIQSIPTTIVFHNGREASRLVGLKSFETLSEILNTILPPPLNRSNGETEARHHSQNHF